MGGLHREVYLYATGPVHLADVFATAGLENDYRDGRLKAQVQVGFPGEPEEGWKVEAALYDPEGKAALARPLVMPVPVESRATGRGWRRISMPG